jgi:GT2 family glycosyltransferase
MIPISSGRDSTISAVCENLSVIIPTLGRDMLEGCLQSIADGSAWPKMIIIVDQSSSPRISAWAERYQSMGMDIKYIASSQKGVAAGRNRGIESCNTEYVAFTDDDCMVEKDWLVSMAASLMNYPAAVITGRVEPGGEGVSVSIKTSTQPQIYTRPLLKEDVLYPNNMGCSKSVFSKVGLFDERNFLRAAEDNDWAYRAQRSGIHIIYYPEVIVRHLDWRNTDELKATYRAYSRSQGGFYGKHLRKGDLFILLRVLVSLARGTRRWFFGIIKKDSDAIARGWFDLTQLPPGILAGFKEGK